MDSDIIWLSAASHELETELKNPENITERLQVE